MPAAVPGIPGGNIHVLERRVASLERLLSNYRKMHVGVSTPGADQRLAIQVLGIRGGEIEGDGGFSPFSIFLFPLAGSPVTYEVSVGWGYVCERIPGFGDALAYHEPDNMWDAEDPSKLRRFPISDGEAIYIRVELKKSGEVGLESASPAVTIVVGADLQTSLHYQPEVDEVDGVAGHFLYKLAVFTAPVAPSTTPTLKKWLSGSHIDHWQELPVIKSALAAGEGIGALPLRWDDTEKCYKFRAISKGTGRNNVSTSGDEVIVRGTKLNADVFVWEGDGPRPSAREFGWEDGYLMTGNMVEVNDDEAPPEPQPIDIKIPDVRVIRGLTIENVGVDGGKVFEIGMPLGASPGDMLYWDGANWILLPAPAAPTAGSRWVLHHTGVAPHYVSYEELEVDICISGVPTPYKILGVPNPPPP